MKPIFLFKYSFADFAILLNIIASCLAIFVGWVTGVATPVPAVTGGAAFLVADFFLVKEVLFFGNLGATAATGMTFVSETKSGATVIEKGQISAATSNSAALTLAGWFAPEAISSTLVQGACFANDLGWISFPFH